MRPAVCAFSVAAPLIPMTTDEWTEVEALYEAALERPPARRVAWVEAQPCSPA